MLYHASQVFGLTVLLPQTSTHQTPYVYAIRGRLTALCFGAPKDDFDLLMDEGEGRPVLWECYPGAFRRIYGGKSCSLYAVKETGFLQGKTGWAPELVCPEAVPVLWEERIPDLFLVLSQAAEAGECILHAYSRSPDYQAMLREELTWRIRQLGLTRAQLNAGRSFPAELDRLLFP